MKAIIVGTSVPLAHPEIGWKSHISRKIPPSALLMSCPAGSSKIWGLQKIVDFAELTRVMPGIRHGRGHQADLLFPRLPVRKAPSTHPYTIIKHVSRTCVHVLVRARAGGEQSYAKVRRQQQSLAKEWHPRGRFCPIPTKTRVLLISSGTRVSCTRSFFARRRQRAAGTTAPFNPPPGLPRCGGCGTCPPDSQPPSIISHSPSRAGTPDPQAQGSVAQPG